MLERMAFSVAAIAVAILMLPFDLSYVGVGIVVAVAILFFDYAWGNDETFRVDYGYLSVVIGVLCLGATFFISKRYGISFEELSHDENFTEFVQRLPYFGVAFMTMGIVVMLKSIFSSRS
jgi:hypothetical protein